MRRRFFSCILVLMLVVSMIPMTAFAETDTAMSEEFKSILNEDGKFVMKSVVPASEDEAYWFFNEMEHMWDKYPDFRFDLFSEDFKSCTIYYKYDWATDTSQESHVVDIVYEYDSDIKTMVDGMISEFPDGGEEGGYYFAVNDMELLSWWLNSGEINTMIDYSGELKSYINYKNFTIDCRMGMDAEFLTEASGMAPFMYDGVVYSNVEMGVRGKHIIYVPDGTEVTKEALMAAAQKRVDEYAGAGKVKITYGGQGIRDYYVNMYDEEIAGYEEALEKCTTELARLETLVTECDTNITNYQSILDDNCIALTELYNQIDNYKSLIQSDPDNAATYEANIEKCQKQIAEYDASRSECENNIAICEQNKMDYMNAMSPYNMEKMNFEMSIEWAQSSKEYVLNSYDEEDGDFYYLQSAAGDYWFNMEIGEATYMFIVVVDSDAMVEPEYRSSDVATDVTVEANDSSIPLDTRINVEKMTSGATYEEIIKTLNVKNNLTFDIKLFSNSLEKYISKLANGKFQVKIPIGTEFKDKNLIVYYVDENKQIQEYEVTVKDGYATFATDHFSIYTLAEKDVTPEIEVNEGSVEVTEDIINEAITNAGTLDTVTLPLEDVAKEVKKVNIPVNSLKEIAKVQKALKIETAKALVTIDVEALEKIVKDAGENLSISLKIDEVKQDKLTTKQQDAIKNREVKQIISAEILCNDKNITEFGGGKIKVQIPFALEAGAKGSDYKVIHIADDGKTEDIATTYMDGCIVVELEHFSEYAIVRASAEAPITADNSLTGLWITVLGMTAVACAGISVISKKKKQYGGR